MSSEHISAEAAGRAAQEDAAGLQRPIVLCPVTYSRVARRTSQMN